ncbi:hypothetical protein ABBQ38_014293 [Trebouxia sp. C0009 RCD-2024]
MAKAADLEPASEPQRLPPGLFPRSYSQQLHSSQPQTDLLTQLPAVGAASVRRSLLGHLQAYTSSYVDPSSLNAFKANSPVPSPDTAAPTALNEDLNDDDAFDAICSLDVLLAPPSVQQPPPGLALDLRRGTERHRRQGSPYTRPSAVRAHTSTTHRSSPEGQTGSPNKADSRRTAAARSAGLGLWTAGLESAAEAAGAAAPMRILKRPVIPDQQAMSSAVSPPLAPTLVVSASSVCKPSSAGASPSAIMVHSAARSRDRDFSPVSASLREDSDKSAQSHAQGHQCISGSSSSDGSASEAPAAPAVLLYTKPAFAKSHAAHHTDLTASDSRTAFASSLDSSSGQSDDPHHSSPAHALLVELHQQPAEGTGLDADSKASQDAASKAVGLLPRQDPKDVLEQARDIAAVPGPPQAQNSSHAACDTAPSQPPPIDVEHSKAAEQVSSQSVLALAHSSVSPVNNTKPALLPAGFMSDRSPQPGSEAAVSQSSQHASVSALLPPSTSQPTTNASPESTSKRNLQQPTLIVPHQLDFLMTDDPVATAIAEANKLVASRAGLMSLADQQRGALNLHVQAKDTYFAAAQTAHEKGRTRQCVTVRQRCSWRPRVRSMLSWPRRPGRLPTKQLLRVTTCMSPTGLRLTFMGFMLRRLCKF